ncbi:CRISPR-associated endonuclease Cas2 [Cyanobium sp. FGCU-6]|nr:CRISPR-associated endonuclease Cas2 [Cyanobium sp. FGCU6]
MIGDKCQIWVIAYDSPSNKRRRKLAKLLEGHGLRVQWSVFECELREDQLQRLRLRLSRMIVSEQDSVRFWPVPLRSGSQSLHLGRTMPSPEWEDRVI